MKKKSGPVSQLNKESCFENAANCQNKSEFQRRYRGSVLWLQEKELYDEATKHMPNIRRKQTKINKVNCFANAEKCQTKTKFSLHYRKSSDWLKDNDFFDEATKHMTGNKNWSEEKAIKAAKRYKTKKAFKVGSSGAYSFAQDKKILDKCYAHLEPPKVTDRKPSKKIKKDEVVVIKNTRLMALKDMIQKKLEDKVKNLLSE
jgi:hypothetical protein